MFTLSESDITSEENLHFAYIISESALTWKICTKPLRKRFPSRSV